MQQMVLADLNLQPDTLDEADAPDFAFTGTLYPSDDVFEMFYAWKSHGIMAVAGGYLDQPIQWHRDMQVCRSLYNVLTWYAVRDAKLKQAAQYTMQMLQQGQGMSFGNGE